MTRCAVPIEAPDELECAMEWLCSMDDANTEVVLLETSLDEEKSVKSAGTVVLLDEKECTNWGDDCEAPPPPPFFAALALEAACNGCGGQGDVFVLLLEDPEAAPAIVPFVLAFKRPNGCCCCSDVAVPPRTFMPRLLVVAAITESMTDCCTHTRCNCSLSRLAECVLGLLLGTTSRGGPFELLPLLLEKVVNDGNGGGDMVGEMILWGNFWGIIGRVAQFYFPAHAKK
jgi:hypothetical protein